MSVPIDYARVLLAGLGVHFLGAAVYSFSGLGPSWVAGHRGPALITSLNTPSKNTRSKTKVEASGRTLRHPAVVHTVSFLSSLLTAYVAAHVLVFAEAYFKQSGRSHALICGIWNFVGFDLTYTLFNGVWLDVSGFSITVDLFYHFLKHLVIMAVLAAPDSSFEINNVMNWIDFVSNIFIV